MYSRITDQLINNNLLQALNQTQQSQNNALTQLETGRTVNQPSDNPAAAALFSASQAQSSQVTQYLQNIVSVNGQLQTGDSALSSAVNLMNQAVTLATEGATGTLSNSDRQALAQQVAQIQQQMVGVANTTFQGTYIFAGTASGPAYKLDATQPDGVSYQGNTGVNQVDIAPGASAAVNLPGSQIFQNGSGSVFQSLQDLETALTTNNAAGAQAASTAINTALGQLNQQRVFYGATVNRLNSTTSFLQNEQMNITKQQNSLVAADMATSATLLTAAETARNAVLAAGAQISHNSLLNYPSPSLG
jgi:flagellar hook-associated protein 3 FlgL